MRVEELLEKMGSAQKFFIVEYKNPKNHVGTFLDPIEIGNVQEGKVNLGKFAFMRVKCFFASDDVLCIFTLPYSRLADEIN